MSGSHVPKQCRSCGDSAVVGMAISIARTPHILTQMKNTLIYV